MVDDEDNENEGNEKKSKGSLVTKILLFGVLPLMTVIILVAGTLFFAGVLPGGGGGGEPAADAVAENSDGEDGADAAEGDGGEESDGEEGGDESLPAIYIPVDPAFVVNFASQGKARFLQVTVEVMTREPEMPDKIKLHMPVIRNNLMLLFSNQTYDGVSTLEGKETLREEALEAVQQILEEETGDPGVEAVYFTSFVMQ